MRKNGFNISPVYQNIMKKLSEVSIHNCNKDNEDVVFKISEEASEEERKTIEELQSVLVSCGHGDYNEKIFAYDKFISTAIGDSILHSKERELGKEESQEEKSL